MTAKSDEAKRKRGRPPSRPELRRDQCVVTFLTSHEMQHLNQLAEAEQVTLSAAVHQLIVQGLAKTKIFAK